MTQFDAREGQFVSLGSDPNVLARSTEQTLLADQVARFIFAVPRGSVVTLGGLDGAIFREILDRSEDIPSDSRVLFVQLQPAAIAEAYIEQVIAALADTAKRLWPLWFGNISFATCRDDVLGREAAGTIVRQAVDAVPDINPAWGEVAARLALAGRQPRVAGAMPALELAQLSLAIGRSELILIMDLNVAADAPSKDALVHALEWIARHSRVAVIALFATLPPLGSPFERILYGAHRVVSELYLGASISEPGRSEGASVWLTPWRGAPHPLSEIEQKLAKMLGDDAELGALFHFNWFVDTVRGSRPKVDLVWMEGRLVVELDGYPDHTTRRAFISDRNRDYELALSGYTVLRLANDEVQQDFGRAVEKIRDLVRLRLSQMNQED
jgi:very-short-patch-repair endonuclease